MLGTLKDILSKGKEILIGFWTYFDNTGSSATSTDIKPWLRWAALPASFRKLLHRVKKGKNLHSLRGM